MKPVILLAFANDRSNRAGFLHRLATEQEQILKALGRAQSEGLCEVLTLSEASIDSILDGFQNPDYRNRIAVFHYAGHADGYRLLLEAAGGKNQIANAGGFAAFLAQQQGLQLVFLNGCSTQAQAEALFEAQVAAVISTSQAISDEVACEFAARFYQGLGGGASLRTAYQEAVAAVKMIKGETPRDFYQEAAAGDQWPWMLGVRPGAEAVYQWNLPEVVDNPLFFLPKVPEGPLPVKPFVHLQRFTRAEAEIFFGRGHAIRELYDRMMASDAPPLLLLYGQAGVGKSSLLEAGLLPRLEGQWAVRYLRRERGLGALGTLRKGLGAGSEESLLQAWQRLEGEKPLLVVLDQLEEAFTQPMAARPEPELEALCAALEGLLGANPRGKLVLGFRKEWLAELEKYLQAHRLPSSKVFLRPLERRGVLEAITGPARVPRLQQAYGLEVSDGLAEEIADDLLSDADSPIAPPLQILLTKLWDEAKRQNPARPRFDSALYTPLRRAGLLLGDLLDQQLRQLQEQRPEAVESGFALDLLTLHTTPIGTSAEHTPEELRQTYPHRPDLAAVVQQGKDLYLLADSGGRTRLTHDTLAPLVRERFARSIYPAQRARRLLEGRAVDWQAGPHGPPLDERDLGTVEQGLAGMRSLRPEESRLLQASRSQRSSNRRRRVALWVSAGLIAIAGTLGVGFVNRVQGISQERARQAQAQRLVARGLGLLERNYDQALLLFLEANRYDTLDTQGQLLSALQSADTRLVRFLSGHSAPVWSLAFSPDGKQLASGGKNVGVLLWEVASGKAQPPLLLAQHRVGTRALGFSGSNLQGLLEDGALLDWNPGASATTRPLAAGLARLSAAAAAKEQMVVADARGLSLLNLQTGSRKALGIRPQRLRALALSPDGKTLALSEGTQLKLWSLSPQASQPLASSAPPQRQITAQGMVDGLAFSPDGKWLALGYEWGEIGLWNLAKNQQEASLLGHQKPVRAMAFGPDAHTLASGGDDGFILLWDLNQAARLGHKVALPRELEAMSHIYSPDGTSLLAWNQQEVAWWSLGEGSGGSSSQTQAQLPTLKGHWAFPEGVGAAALSPEAKTLAVRTPKGVVLWDIAQNQPRQTWTIPEGLEVYTLQFDPGGKILALTDNTRKVHLWDVAAARPLGALNSQVICQESGGCSGGEGAAFVPGTSLLATDRRGSLELWNLTDPGASPRQVFFRDLNNPHALGFRPDGRVMVSGDYQVFQLWDYLAQRPLGKPWKVPRDSVGHIGFSPDGQQMLSSNLGREVWRWEVSPEAWRAQACALVNRNLSQEEWSRLVGDIPYAKTCPQAADVPGLEVSSFGAVAN